MADQDDEWKKREPNVLSGSEWTNIVDAALRDVVKAATYTDAINLCSPVLICLPSRSLAKAGGENSSGENLDCEIGVAD